MSDDDTATQAEGLATASADFWSGVASPNAVALVMARQFAATRDGFVSLRGTTAFEDEPAGFTAALLATKETGA